MNNPTPAQVTAWLDHETGYATLQLEPMETEAERHARLIATANRQPLPPAAIYSRAVLLDEEPQP